MSAFEKNWEYVQDIIAEEQYGSYEYEDNKEKSNCEICDKVSDTWDDVIDYIKEKL